MNVEAFCLISVIFNKLQSASYNNRTSIKTRFCSRNHQYYYLLSLYYNITNLQILQLTGSTFMFHAIAFSDILFTSIIKTGVGSTFGTKHESSWIFPRFSDEIKKTFSSINLHSIWFLWKCAFSFSRASTQNNLIMRKKKFYNFINFIFTARDQRKCFTLS